MDELCRKREYRRALEIAATLGLTEDMVIRWAESQDEYSGRMNGAIALCEEPSHSWKWPGSGDPLEAFVNILSWLVFFHPEEHHNIRRLVMGLDSQMDRQDPRITHEVLAWYNSDTVQTFFAISQGVG
jgi:hypothetical protein